MKNVLGLRLDLAGGALTQYAGFDFNSLALVGGELYAASDQGLFRIGAGAQDDAGKPIAASLALVPADFGHEGRKTLRCVDICGRSQTGLRLGIVSDDGEERERSVRPFGMKDGLPGRERTQAGRDGQGVVFALSLENEDGGDFLIASIEAAFLALDRR